MNKPAAFSLRIFVADGDPDGLQIVERTNWVGKALVFPRVLYPKVRTRDEFKQTGVYLLIGPRPDGPGELLYIGEGDPVGDRLASHIKEKDFWNRAIFFVAPGFLNKAHVQFLEARLIAIANAAKRAALENGNSPYEPSLSEADRADMEVFLLNILGMLPVLGVNAFDRAAASSATPGSAALTCSGKGVSAKGSDTPQGFVVFSGSEAAAEVVESLTRYFPNVIALRNELLKSQVLVPKDKSLKFTQDYIFNSPSLAAAIVLGRSAGLSDWKDPSGRTLKDIQAQQTSSE